MKKLFFASALVAGMGMWSGCSNDDVVATGGNVAGSANDGLVPVELAVAGPSVSVEKRGIGSVGDFGERGNWWNGEKLRVLMLERSEKGDGHGWRYSQWLYRDANKEDALTKVVNSPNDEVTTPEQTKVETDNKLKWTVQTKPRYYPNEGTHDFFAYHLDDAAYLYELTTEFDTTSTAENKQFIVKDSVVTPNSHATLKYVWFKIDGSQDLMTGVAVKKSSTDELAEDNEGFSAATARAGVIPNIVMQHRLTRFVFQVAGMNAGCDGVSVEKITVKSKTTGKMIVAYDRGGEAVAPTQTLLFETPTGSDATLEEALVLKDYDSDQKKTVDLSSVNLEKGQGEWGENWQPVGHCLMVAPGEKEYEMEITLKQTFKTDDDSTNPVGKTTITRKITIPEEATAAEGTSYNVKVKVYGMEKIEVEASLTAWKEGGDIEVDTNLDGGVSTEDPDEEEEESAGPQA
jgi:hypothetical protein